MVQAKRCLKVSLPAMQSTRLNQYSGTVEVPSAYILVSNLTDISLLLLNSSGRDQLSFTFISFSLSQRNFDAVAAAAAAALYYSLLILFFPFSFANSNYDLLVLLAPEPV